MLNLGAGAARPRVDRGAIEAIRAWVRQATDLPDTAHVLVTEVRCAEPGCPPVETVIAVMAAGEGTRQYKVVRPLAEVTDADVRRALAGPPIAGAGHTPTGGAA
jgi:hypothetical protein